MCNVRTEHVDILRNSPAVRGKFLSQLFPKHFMENIPYENIKVGCCIQCGRRMHPNEMEPPGRQTPRAMCPECYDYLTSNISDECPICGEYLPKRKVDAQRGNPKEVSHRIHDGKCLDYFSIISCKALGDDMSFLADESQWYNKQEPIRIGDSLYNNDNDGRDYLEQTIRNVIQKEISRLNPGRTQKSLPNPSRKFSPSDYFDNRDIKKTYKGKDIVFVPKKRR